MRLLDDEPDIPAQINILPMIDVIFSILTFFIISSLFLTRNEGLPVNLPQASTAQRQRQSQITVTIDPQGKISVNRDSIELEKLEGSVRQLIESSQTTLVVLNADEAIQHGRVVEVMDRLRRIEEAKLAIATRKPTEKAE